MNKGNLGKNLRELPPRKRKEEINYEEMRQNLDNRELREKRIKEQADNLMKEQRNNNIDDQINNNNNKKEEEEEGFNTSKKNYKEKKILNKEMI